MGSPGAPACGAFVLSHEDGRVTKSNGARLLVHSQRYPIISVVMLPASSVCNSAVSESTCGETTESIRSADVCSAKRELSATKQATYIAATGGANHRRAGGCGTASVCSLAGEGGNMHDTHT